MTILDLAFIQNTLALPLSNVNATVNRIVIDSRDIQIGDVFVAVKGERFDGHDFVDEVLAKGALACLVSRADCTNKPSCLKVEDTVKALGQLAQAWRLQVNPELKVFGITGSAGKTTVKEMLATILKSAVGEQAVLATVGNFNNHIGLPLTLLQLKPQHQYAVIEMGMNHAGELAYLTDLARPDFALVNNTLRAHIGCGFNDVEDIARAKSEIYQGLNQKGLAFLPCEDQQMTTLQKAVTKQTKITFGLNQGDVHAEQIILQTSGSQFMVVTPTSKIMVELPVPGIHMVHNAIAAAAMALSAGISTEQLASLAHFSNVKGRLQQKRSKHGALLIDDTYNANPDAYIAAIDVLAAFPAPRILVMGAIGELGINAPELHAEVGAYARQQGIETLLCIGEYSQYAAIAYGQPQAFYTDKIQLIKALRKYDQAEATILIKGSRFMQMETVVSDLMTE